jgi:DNA-directed RNA polymerase specialized sigma24 family protein
MPWPDDFPEWAERASPVVYQRLYGQLRRGRPREAAADLAEEATQYALLRAAEGASPPGGFLSFAHFVNWLGVVGRNHALTQLRRCRPTAAAPEALADGDPGPRGWCPAVWDCLGRLPLQRRRVLLLWYYHHLTDADIGLLEFDPAEGTSRALGLRAYRIRHAALEELGQLLLAAGVDPEDWHIPERNH